MASFRSWFVVGLCAWACAGSGCAPVLSDAVLQQVETAPPFETVRDHPREYLGTLLVVGGTILQVRRVETGSELEVLQRPLGFRLKPKLGDTTGGRFLVRTDQVLENEIFAKGRLITIAGRVAGEEERLLGEATYRYPVLELEEYYLWPAEGGNGTNMPRVFLGIGISTSF